MNTLYDGHELTAPIDQLFSEHGTVLNYTKTYAIINFSTVQEKSIIIYIFKISQGWSAEICSTNRATVTAGPSKVKDYAVRCNDLFSKVLLIMYSWVCF
jgi:hypothetical protein